MSVKRRIAYLFVGVVFLLNVYCVGRYVEEERWLGKKAAEILRESGAVDRRGRVMAIRDYLRTHVRYEGAPHDNRPFLRATAREILESGQGYCGESSRACISLLSQLGIPARRINLYGEINHVVVEADLGEGLEILIDPQNNRMTNPYFDGRDRELDSILGNLESPFSDYSTVHVRRIPIVGTVIQRVRLRSTTITRAMESPWLIRSFVIMFIVISALTMIVLDRFLIRWYAARLGVRRLESTTGPRPGTQPGTKGSDCFTSPFSRMSSGHHAIDL